MNEYEKRAREAKLKEMCEHMRALVAHCNEVGVRFGGCGDCGSAWLECSKCNKTVSDAHMAFYGEES